MGNFQSMGVSNDGRKVADLSSYWRDYCDKFGAGRMINNMLKQFVTKRTNITEEQIDRIFEGEMSSTLGFQIDVDFWNDSPVWIICSLMIGSDNAGSYIGIKSLIVDYKSKTDEYTTLDESGVVLDINEDAYVKSFKMTFADVDFIKKASFNWTQLKEGRALKRLEAQSIEPDNVIYSQCNKWTTESDRLYRFFKKRGVRAAFPILNDIDRRIEAACEVPKQYQYLGAAAAHVEFARATAPPVEMLE
jgi:hypothetical protein